MKDAPKCSAIAPIERNTNELILMRWVNNVVYLCFYFFLNWGSLTSRDIAGGFYLKLIWFWMVVVCCFFYFSSIILETIWLSNAWLYKAVHRPFKSAKTREESCRQKSIESEEKGCQRAGNRTEKIEFGIAWALCWSIYVHKQYGWY